MKQALQECIADFQKVLVYAKKGHSIEEIKAYAAGLECGGGACFWFMHWFPTNHDRFTDFYKKHSDTLYIVTSKESKVAVVYCTTPAQAIATTQLRIERLTELLEKL